jgi:uncharacterized protein YjiS (DUF1127 family)
MSTIELEGLAPTRTREPSLLRAAFAGLWQAWLNHREARHTLRLLQKMDARTLRDMGFEPAEIYGTRLGIIGEIHGDAWKGLDR